LDILTLYGFLNGKRAIKKDNKDIKNFKEKEYIFYLEKLKNLENQLQKKEMRLKEPH
jgi:hypothetical protein